jgi:hypothetical protein
VERTFDFMPFAVDAFGGLVAPESRRKKNTRVANLKLMANTTIIIPRNFKLLEEVI